MVDTAPLFPSALKPAFVDQLRAFYVTSFRDKFFEDQQPAWFRAFIWMELVYHAPLSGWAIGALLRDDPLIPIHLLVFGVQSLVTSVACLAEVWSWADRTLPEKQNLSMLYGPYVALGAFMTLDILSRLRSQLSTKIKRD